MRHGSPRQFWDHPPRSRPSWWPKNEPFPPAGSDWPRLRQRFVNRMIGFALMAFIAFSLFMTAIAFAVWSLFSALTGGQGNPFLILGVLFVLFFIFRGGRRGVRRVVAPLADLVTAAERVESGDYSARVNVRGPRETRALGNAFNAMSARLERSEEERTRLLADVTHELRTPLTVIQGNIEALIDGVHPPDERRFRALLEDTKVLSRLIDDLRTVSIADAGALPLHRERTDLARLARETAASFEAQAMAQGTKLVVDADGAVEADVDPFRVREVLTNIVANALRYTPLGGSVTIEVRPAGTNASIVVRDTGAGIAPDVLPHIFERFTHAPDSPGAGLGLAIAKGLVNAHGGEISAASEPGLGTEIRFTLPRGATASS